MALATGAALVAGGSAAIAEGGGGPDLKVAKVAGAPEAVLAGHAFDARVTVRNRGDARSPASRLSAFLSTDYRTDAGDVRLDGAPKVKRLKRHRAVTKPARFHVPKDTRPGTYRLIVCADARQVVQEQRESNNCRTAPDDVRVPRISPPTIPPPPW